jgi:hypothetical protein
MTSPRARIFLSSGQTDGSSEVQRVLDVKKRLEYDFDFLVTVGTGTNAVTGVAGEVFRRLREAEYLILIDFARGEVSRDPLSQESFRRGSLFSEQEFAVAVYREIPYLVFQESGMIKRDGLLRHIASEPIEFNQGNLVDKVISRVREELREGRWDSAWRNELGLSRENRGPDAPDWIRYGDDGKLHAKYFHVKVENRHRDQLATGVHAYLEGWSETSKPREVQHPPLVEIKFRGVRTKSVSIPPKNYREFDAILVLHEVPGRVWVGINTFLRDWTGLDELYHFQGAGREIDLQFVVFCDQFDPVRQTFRLRIGKDGDSTELYVPRNGDSIPKVAAQGFRAVETSATSGGSGVVLSQVEGATVTAEMRIKSE